MKNRTFQMPKEQGLAERRWFVLDADGAVLGRLATRAANLLRGKGKPTFTPHVDCGDFVIVINAAKVKLTGNKEAEKLYRRHTGYPGGVRALSAEEVRARHPQRLIEEAIAGMLPKNRLARALVTKLKIYPGAEHPHQAQKPEAVAVAG
ncbi:MAG: 50S ribosomal protein L13 [Candidatus Binatia bacterium]